MYGVFFWMQKEKEVMALEHNLSLPQANMEVEDNRFLGLPAYIFAHESTHKGAAISCRDCEISIYTALEKKNMLPKILQRLCFRCKNHIMYADSPVPYLVGGAMVQMHASCKELWDKEVSNQELEGTENQDPVTRIIGLMDDKDLWCDMYPTQTEEGWQLVLSDSYGQTVETFTFDSEEIAEQISKRVGEIIGSRQGAKHEV